MKNSKILSFMLLAMVFVMPAFVSCSSDDDEGALNYTSEEIVEMLTGKWAIKGKFIINSVEGNKKQGEYSGEISFSKSDKGIWVSKYRCKTINVDDLEFNLIKYSSSYDSYSKYEVMRKDSKLYLSLPGNSRYLNFQIISISKTSFKLILDEPSEEISYVTMISQ